MLVSWDPLQRCLSSSTTGQHRSFTSGFFWLWSLFSRKIYCCYLSQIVLHCITTSLSLLYIWQYFGLSCHAENTWRNIQESRFSFYLVHFHSFSVFYLRKTVSHWKQWWVRPQHISIVRNKDKNIIWIDNYILLRIC